MVSLLRWRRGGNNLIPQLYGGTVKGYTLVDNRENLVAGVDKPNVANNTGPYTVTQFQDVYPPAGLTYITIGAPGTDGPFGDAHYGKRYWGQIRVNEGLADWAVKFRECEFVGQDPTTIASNNPGLIKAYGNNPSKCEIYDSYLSPVPWIALGKPLNAYSMGIHGGNYRVYRSEFYMIQDPWNWIGPNGTVTSAVSTQEHLSQQNWYHKGWYANNINPPTDGQVHSDGFQTNFGKNLTIRGDYIGGVRDMRGYWTWPVDGAQPYIGTGSNTGDDFFGAAIMLKQEPSFPSSSYSFALHGIENVLIENNWIEGCSHGINHASNSNYPNTFSSTIVRNNRFIPRTGPDSANWNLTYQLQNGVVSSAPVVRYTGDGSYIIRANTMTSTYSGNVLDTTGTAVTIDNGGP